MAHLDEILQDKDKYILHNPYRPSFIARLSAAMVLA